MVDWDFHDIYRLPDDAPTPKKSYMYQKMGETTNLIMDMTLAGAPMEQVIKVVKHSMVVIDANKHRLDWKQSEKDNDIIAIKKEWQGTASNGAPKGASTIITKAKSEAHPNKRREITRVSDMTPEEKQIFESGRKVYRSIDKELANKIKTLSPEEYTPLISKKLGISESNVKNYIGDRVRIKNPDKMTPEEKKIFESGRKVYRQVTPKPRQEKVPKMYLADDAMELVKNPLDAKEVAYANYANALKDMANAARKESRSIKPNKVDPVAKGVYKEEVDTLLANLRIAKSNAPKERKAQRLANKIVNEKIKSNPALEDDSEHLTREKGRALISARAAVGAHKDPIYITDKQWKAIQANALSTNVVTEIFMNSDTDRFRELATPRTQKSLNTSQIALLKAMFNTGMYTNKEIADKFGVSTSMLYEYLKK